MDDKIKVACRFRPLSLDEQESFTDESCRINDSTSITVPLENKTFTYDYVADEKVSQAKFFDKVGQDVCKSGLEGYNVTIMHYGRYR